MKLRDNEVRGAGCYYRHMGARCTGSLLTLFLGVPICSAQAPLGSGRPAAYVEIKLPVGVRSETMFVRYELDDDFGGWVQPHPDVSSYFISTSRQGTPATRFRALVYAPGCAIQTIRSACFGSGCSTILIRVPTSAERQVGGHSDRV